MAVLRLKNLLNLSQRILFYDFIPVSILRMEVTGARNPISTEPNQALQRTNMLVTDCAPSSTLRAKHVRR
jgi:hypothetical protein